MWLCVYPAFGLMGQELLWFQYVLALVLHLQLQLCSQTLICSSSDFQRHIPLSVLLWLPSPVFISFSSLRAFVTMAKKNKKTQDKSLMHFVKLKLSVDHHHTATITRLSWVLSLCRGSLMLLWHIHWKKLRGEQEDTQDDADERRVNVYSFNTDKYSYVSAVRI